MRALIQRVNRARVMIGDRVSGEIGSGMLILLGISHEDDERDVLYLVEKCVNLRIFDDDEGKMNRSLLDIGGAVLVVSQFTLYGDCRKGRRPSYTAAAGPEQAISLYERFICEIRKLGFPVETGEFGAMMELEIHNSGPVTIMLES